MSEDKDYVSQIKSVIAKLMADDDISNIFVFKTKLMLFCQTTLLFKGTNDGFSLCCNTQLLKNRHYVELARVESLTTIIGDGKIRVFDAHDELKRYLISQSYFHRP